MSEDMEQPKEWTCTHCGATFPTHQKLGGHLAGKHHTKLDRVECDGTVQDYRRHRGRKERACAASKAAWRKRQAELRKEGKA